MKFSKSFTAIFISVVLCLELLTTFAVNTSNTDSLILNNQEITAIISEYDIDLDVPSFSQDEVFFSQNNLSSDTPVSAPLLNSEMTVVNNVMLSQNVETQNSSVLDYKILSFAVDTTNHSTTAIIKLTNNTTTKLSFNLHSGLYTESGVLGGYNITPLSFLAGETKLVTVVTPNTSKQTVNTLKLFFWDDNMHPVCEPILKTFNYVSTAQSISFSNPTPVINYKISTTYQLSCTVNPSKYSGGITYKSTDTSVATVNQSGLVTGIKNGTTIITATTNDGGAFAYCTLTVNNDQISVSLNREEINMWSGYTYTLIPTTSPVNGLAVTYVSSDTSVLTVSAAGVITAKSPGFATVSVFCGDAMSICMVSVYNEADYIGTVAAKYESNGNPGTISSGSGDAGGKSYGAFQFSSSSNGPKLFYNWLISSGFNTEIGTALRDAHNADGGKDYTFGTNFDALWKLIAAEAPQEFLSAQLTYTKVKYYDALYNMLIKSTASGGLGFNANNYGIALKSALFSRALQHGVTGAFNRIKEAFSTIGGFAGKTERELIAAIYAECGAVVTTPPSANSIKMDSSSSIAVQYGLVGKYMKYYSLNSSSIQASVWRRLNVYEPNDLYALLDNPPINITPQD